MKEGRYYITWINDLHHLLMNFLGLESMPGLIKGQSFNAPAWFLTVIFICYILLYIISRYLDREKVIYVSFLLMILGVFLVYDENMISFPMLNSGFGRGYLSFFWGVILAAFFERLDEHSIKMLGGGVAAFLIIIWGYAFSVNLLGNINTTFTLCVCTGIVILIKTSRIVSNILNIKLLQILGKASFSIYLWNFPTDMMFDLINRRERCFDYTRISFWILHFLLSIGLALFSHYVIEPRLNMCFERIVEKYIFQKEN